MGSTIPPIVSVKHMERHQKREWLSVFRGNGSSVLTEVELTERRTGVQKGKKGRKGIPGNTGVKGKRASSHFWERIAT